MALRKTVSNIRYRHFAITALIIELLINVNLFISVYTNNNNNNDGTSMFRYLYGLQASDSILLKDNNNRYATLPYTTDRNSTADDYSTNYSSDDSSSDHYDNIKEKETRTTNDENINSSSDSLSACMLVKDDNDIINEWLAYHYYTMKLRYLVIAVDPNSVSSPTVIFNKWRTLTNLTIIEWTDTNFVSKEFIKNGYHISPSTINGNANQSKWHQGHESSEQVIADITTINNHRYRQVTFYSRCLRHMRRQQKRWVLHIDTDEYVVINPLLRRNMQRFKNKTFGSLSLSSSERRYGLPSIRKPSSIFNFFTKGLMADEFMIDRAHYPCISLPRLLFGSIELTDTDTVTDSQTYSKELNYTSLATRRWKYHTTYNDTTRNAQPKVLIDISNISTRDELFNPNKNVFSIHRPSRRLCRGLDKIDMTLFNQYPLSVNHYIGSTDRYFARTDTRRSMQAYTSKAYVNNGMDDNWLSQWIDGFIQYVGTSVARQLLNNYYYSTDRRI